MTVQEINAEVRRLTNKILSLEEKSRTIMFDLDISNETKEILLEIYQNKTIILENHIGLLIDKKSKFIPYKDKVNPTKINIGGVVGDMLNFW